MHFMQLICYNLLFPFTFIPLRLMVKVILYPAEEMGNLSCRRDEKFPPPNPSEFSCPKLLPFQPFCVFCKLHVYISNVRQSILATALY